MIEFNDKLPNKNLAPLPFRGQKYLWVEAFKNKISKIEEDYVFIDLFGGSGVLSKAMIDVKPKSRVIYNDYDNYINRCENIDVTNRILFEISKIIPHYNRGEKIGEVEKCAIFNFLDSFEEDIDSETIFRQLTFVVERERDASVLERKRHLYHNMNKRVYNSEYVKSYHDGIEVVHMDWFELFEKTKNLNCLYIADPPYLKTDNRGYGSGYVEDNWRDSDFLKINETLIDYPHIFFTSSKSGLVEQFYKTNAFDSRFIRVNKRSAGYIEYMIYHKI